MHNLTVVLAIPVLLVTLIPVVVPILGKLLTDLFGKKVPKRAKPYVALAVGTAAGAAAHYAGLPHDTAAIIAAAGGPGAIAAHELWKTIKVPQVGTDKKN